MWTTLVEFLARVGIYFVKRADNPELLYRKEVAKNEKAILEGDAAAVNAQLELGLDSVQKPFSGNTKQ